MKTALLAATTLITLATSSQAGPSWKDVLKEVVIASAQPQYVYVAQPGYCYTPPRVIHYAQPPYHCREMYQPRPVYRDRGLVPPGLVIVENSYGQRTVVPR